MTVKEARLVNNFCGYKKAENCKNVLKKLVVQNTRDEMLNEHKAVFSEKSLGSLF